MEHREFTVHDRLGPLTFTGTILSDQRFGSRDLPRWTDMALYRVVETERDPWFTMRCRGCLPKRVMLVNADGLDDKPLTCDACGRNFDVPETPFCYLLEILARSRVYHKDGSSCVKNKHRMTTAGDVKRNYAKWQSLVPCSKCRPAPLVNMTASQRIAQERQDNHIYLCSDANTLVRRLYHHSGEISGLAAALLREAARYDRDLAEVIKRGRRI